MDSATVPSCGCRLAAVGLALTLALPAAAECSARAGYDGWLPVNGQTYFVGEPVQASAMGEAGGRSVIDWWGQANGSIAGDTTVDVEWTIQGGQQADQSGNVAMTMQGAEVMWTVDTSCRAGVFLYRLLQEQDIGPHTAGWYGEAQASAADPENTDSVPYSWDVEAVAFSVEGWGPEPPPEEPPGGGEGDNLGDVLSPDDTS